MFTFPYIQRPTLQQVVAHLTRDYPCDHPSFSVTPLARGDFSGRHERMLREFMRLRELPVQSGEIYVLEDNWAFVGGPQGYLVAREDKAMIFDTLDLSSRKSNVALAFRRDNLITLGEICATGSRSPEFSPFMVVELPEMYDPKTLFKGAPDGLYKVFAGPHPVANARLLAGERK